jgi:hypothetical protein
VVLVPTVVSAGWAAGVNSYATLALLGILGRAGVGEVPDELTGTAVIATALALFAIEFVVDKVPYLDTTWDVIQTPIRPAVGAVVGALFAGDAHVDAFDDALAAAGGGTTALASHAVKASVRLGVNTSPEPASNIAVSLIEDGLVALVIALALDHPWVSLAIVAVLLAGGLALVFVIQRRIRRAWRAWRRRRDRAPPDAR